MARGWYYLRFLRKLPPGEVGSLGGGPWQREQSKGTGKKGKALRKDTLCQHSLRYFSIGHLNSERSICGDWPRAHSRT